MGHTSRFRSSLGVAASALGLATASLLASATTAGAAVDPTASAALAGAVKQAMEADLRKQVPGLVVTKVTCFVPTTGAVAGKCTAKFKVPRFSLLGVYQVKAKLDNRSRLSWSTSSAACTDSRTHQRASCTSKTNTGNGLISPRIAEEQLLANGFTVGAAKRSAKSAVCRGEKSHKWHRGAYDDVFAQLDCTVRAADGAYKLVFVMTGSRSYKLTGVAKTT